MIPSVGLESQINLHLNIKDKMILPRTAERLIKVDILNILLTGSEKHLSTRMLN